VINQSGILYSIKINLSSNGHFLSVKIPDKEKSCQTSKQ
jgi:hypothetical protein